jgi:rhodanese-related sulfurtransferase
MGITKEQVRDSLDENKMVVLNVLSSDEYEKLHIAGTRSQPLGQNHSAFAQEVEKQYGPGRSFITYSTDITCGAAGNAAKILREHGFQAEEYAGGMDEWNSAGWPVEGILAQGARFTKKISAHVSRGPNGLDRPWDREPPTFSPK